MGENTPAFIAECQASRTRFAGMLEALEKGELAVGDSPKANEAMIQHLKRVVLEFDALLKIYGVPNA